MIHLVIGVFITTIFFFLLHYSSKQNLKIQLWQWILTIACLSYIVFVLEVIVSMVSEGTIKGAVVMGVIMGFIAVIWSVLLGRFVFRSSVKS
jgi:hypothetical protein